MYHPSTFRTSCMHPPVTSGRQRHTFLSARTCRSQMCISVRPRAVRGGRTRCVSSRVRFARLAGLGPSLTHALVLARARLPSSRALVLLSLVLRMSRPVCRPSFSRPLSSRPSFSRPSYSRLSSSRLSSSLLSSTLLVLSSLTRPPRRRHPQPANMRHER